MEFYDNELIRSMPDDAKLYALPEGTYGKLLCWNCVDMPTLSDNVTVFTKLEIAQFPLEPLCDCCDKMIDGSEILTDEEYERLWAK